MSSFLKSISNLPTSLVNTMSTSWFSRIWWTKEPAKIEPAPTPEQQAEDRAAFEKAVTDAVAAAIKNDEFTQAVATNLAEQLQPSLKAALDISSVETKLLTSHEQLLKRVDEVDSQLTSKLADLSSLVETSSTTTAGKISAIEAAVANISLSLSELGNNVKALQEQVASPDTTLQSQQTLKLDNLATEIKSIQEQIASPDTSLLSSHTTKLDNIAIEIVALKENPPTAAILKTITSDLTSIKDAHTSHTAALAEIKAANEAAAPKLSGLETQVGTVISSLSAIQSSDVNHEILIATKASNESHAAHSAALNEIKAATATPVKLPEPTDISGLETSVKSIITTLGSQGNTLEEIKAVTSAPAPVVEKTDLTSLETSVKTIVTTLDSQTATLLEIKTGSSSTEILSAIHGQDAVLAEIKGSAASTEITTSIQTVKSDISASKDAVIEKVESLKAVIAALPTTTAAASAESGKTAAANDSAVENGNGKVEDHGVTVEAKEVATEA
jgi:hypothetical protein